jgi:hypothetical protein
LVEVNNWFNKYRNIPITPIDIVRYFILWIFNLIIQLEGQSDAFENTKVQIPRVKYQGLNTKGQIPRAKYQGPRYKYQGPFCRPCG